MVSRVFVIPTGGRNLLVAGSAVLQATADSSTATPFRNDKNVEVCSGICSVGGHNPVCKTWLGRHGLPCVCHSDRREESACGWQRGAAGDSRFLHGYAVSE